MNFAKFDIICNYYVKESTFGSLFYFFLRHIIPSKKYFRVNSLITLFFLVLLKSNAQVIDYTTNIVVEKGVKVTEKTIVMQINNRESLWLSNIEIPYSANQKCEILEAYITNLYGDIERKLKKKEIHLRSDISSGTFFEDNYIKEFNLNWDQYPYRLIYKYRITESDFIYISKWYPVLYPDIRVLNASLKLVLPSDFMINKEYSEGFNFQSWKTDKSQFFDWKISNYKPEGKETFSLPLEELIPCVTITPINFNYSIPGKANSWSAFGNWVTRLNMGTDILSYNEQMKVDQLTSGVESEREKIRILYHYMQDNTRYVNVAIDYGGLKSYPASYVCNKKYGDCKALTTYMKALLKHAGIESYYTLVNSGSNKVKINQDIPGQQFNHVILFIPSSNDTIWLENTSNYLPFNYTVTSTQNRFALICKSENSCLVKTPELSTDDVLNTSTYRYYLNQDGTGRVLIDKILRGNNFEKFVYYKNEMSDEELKLRVEEDLNIKNYEIINWSIEQITRDSHEIRLYVELSLKDCFREIANMKVIEPLRIKIPKVEEVEDRNNDIIINYPVNIQDSIFYDISESDCTKITVPKDTIIESRFGYYSESYSLKNKILKAKKTFCLRSGNYSINQYMEFKEFFDTIEKNQNQSLIILTKTE